jgi:hypothetical protein
MSLASCAYDIVFLHAVHRNTDLDEASQRWAFADEALKLLQAELLENPNKGRLDYWERVDFF